MGRTEATASRVQHASADCAERRRLAIVTPHFWPLIDDRSLHLLRLSEAFHDAGCEVTVVTPRWTRNWPTRIALGKVNVQRLPGNAMGGLGLLRWLYALGRWLQSNPQNAVVVAGLQREAQVTLTSTVKRAITTLLLASENDLVCQANTVAERRAVARWQQASVVVAPTTALRTKLMAAGHAEHQITVIPRSATAVVSRSAESRASARLSLAAANYDLATVDKSLVALAVGRLDEQHRQGDLVRAWRIVTASRPEAKLWIVGDGPERDRLYQQVGDLDQRFRVMLPGMFERHDELLQAADLLVVPAQHQVPPVVLHDALAAGLPVVAADGIPDQQMVAAQSCCRVFPVGDSKALAAAVLLAFESQSTDPVAAQVCEPRTAANEAAEYLALLDRLQSNPADIS